MRPLYGKFYDPANNTRKDGVISNMPAGYYLSKSSSRSDGTSLALCTSGNGRVRSSTYFGDYR